MLGNNRIRLFAAAIGVLAAMTTTSAPALAASDASGVGLFIAHAYKGDCNLYADGTAIVHLGSTTVHSSPNGAMFDVYQCGVGVDMSLYINYFGRAVSARPNALLPTVVCRWHGTRFGSVDKGTGSCSSSNGGNAAFPAKVVAVVQSTPAGGNKLNYVISMVIY
jgi:hypothetical protein